MKLKKGWWRKEVSMAEGRSVGGWMGRGERIREGLYILRVGHRGIVGMFGLC